MSPSRVLVVDDSAAMRAMLTHILSQDPALEVIGSAAEPMRPTRFSSRKPHSSGVFASHRWRMSL